jgi:hypothetical protein
VDRATLNRRLPTSVFLPGEIRYSIASLTAAVLALRAADTRYVPSSSL